MWNRSSVSSVGSTSWRGDSLLGAAGHVIAGCVAAATLWVALACTPREPRCGDVVAIAYTATAIPLAWGNPICWSHNYLVVLLAAGAVVQRFAKRATTGLSRGDRLALGAALFGWLLMSQPYRLARLLGYDVDSTDLIGMLLKSNMLYGVALFWGVLLRELRLSAPRDVTLAREPLQGQVAVTGGHGTCRPVGLL
jgi:hypothetical protein